MTRNSSQNSQRPAARLPPMDVEGTTSTTTNLSKSANSGQKFQPYHGTPLDASFFHMVLEPVLPYLLPLLSPIYAVRWQLSRPLQVLVLPKWFPFFDVPFLRDLTFLTYGQLLLALPLIVLFLCGYYYTFVAASTISSGQYAAYTTFGTFLTANKCNSLVAFLFGIPFERMIPFHNFSALLTVILSCFHGYVAYAYTQGSSNNTANSNLPETTEGDHLSLDVVENLSSDYSMNGSNPNLSRFLFDGDINTTGTLLAFTMLIMVLTSIHPWLRRNLFDVWLWVHILSAACVVTFAVLHQVTTILFIAIWWIVDLFTRYVVMAGCRYPHVAKLELVTDHVVRISFEKPKNFSYNPGQFAQIAIPDLGPLAFHPFSISSAPHESRVEFHVRALGDWTHRLVELAKLQDEVTIFMEGPYGSLSVDIDDDSRYKMVVLVCGGIGVTHCNSVAKSILKDHQRGRKLKHLRFVWAVRDLEMLRAKDPLEEPESLDVERGMHLTSSSDSVALSHAHRRGKRAATKPRIVETDIFVTNASRGVPVSLTAGRTIHYGRPNIDAIIQDTKERAIRLGVTHVAVFGCGPKVLIDSVKDTCRVHSQMVTELQGVTFDVHEEIFEF